MDEVDAPYDAIAEWYDVFVGGPIYEELVLPAVLDFAGKSASKRIVDVACGQGMIARELARRGAEVTGVDISQRMLDIAERYEQTEPLGIVYVRDNAQSLQKLASRAFDGAICNLALMDIVEVTAAFGAIRRVLCHGGWLIVTITHPCFEVPRGQWATRSDGTVVREVTGYFDEGYWRSDNPHGIRGQVGAYHRTLSTYLNALADAGFRLERVHEPRATGRRAHQVPGNREVPSLLLLKALAGA